MPSSPAFSPLHLELRRSRTGGVVTAVAAVVAALASWLTALPVPMAALVYLLAVLISWRELRHARPQRLRWQSDGSVWLDWPDGAETAVEVRDARHLGRLSVLQLARGSRFLRVVLWPDMLSDRDRKALRRRLNGHRVVSDSVSR